MRSIALLSLVALPFFAACTISSSSNNSGPAPLHSSDLETNQMKVTLSAQSGDSNVKVYASLFAKDSNGDLVGVSLDQGETFSATIPGWAPVALVAEPADGSNITYSATLPLATAAEDITIALARGNGQVSAPKSVVHLPAPFAITKPSPAPASVKIGTKIPVTISPAPELSSVQLEVIGSCVADNSSGYSDPDFDANGLGTIDTSQITVNGSGGCSADLYLDVVGPIGTIDSAFAGGLFGLGDAQAEQRRAITTTLTQ